jgi:hypothetical protein
MLSTKGRCDADLSANPDSVVTLNDSTLLIGEDAGMLCMVNFCSPMTPLLKRQRSTFVTSATIIYALT